MVVHVLVAVFIVGPMAVLPMSAMRAIRAGEAGQVVALARSTRLLTVLSLVVVLAGFAAMSAAPARDHLSVLTPWILISVLLWIVAVAVNLGLVVPSLQRAAEALSGTDRAGRSRYPAIAGGSGIVALLLAAVVVLMVWRP